MTNDVKDREIPWWLVLIEGIATIILGLLLFTQLAATRIVLVRFLGIIWLITGIFKVVSLLWDRTAWGWKLFSGCLGIFAGVFIIQNLLWSTLIIPTTIAIMLGIIGILIWLLQLIDALHGAGVDTVVELAQRNPEKLYAKINEVNTEKYLVRKMPTVAQVDDWLSQAKSLPWIVTY